MCKIEIKILLNRNGPIGAAVGTGRILFLYKADTFIELVQ